jgi:5-methylcytosine-specific restriction endonuclease McrA
VSQSTCTYDNCDKPHRARELCATHYNQTHQPNRHRKVEVACDSCGKLVMKDVANTRAARFCSMICRDVYRLEQTGGDPMAVARAAWKPRAAKAEKPKSCPLYVYECGICGTVKCARGARARYCSPRCRDRARHQRRGKRHSIRRTDIFERDGYVCWICEQPCNPTLTVPHPRAATIDHLVPQSLGGGHEHNNLATAHMSCNSSRGASLTYP